MTRSNPAPGLEDERLSREQTAREQPEADFDEWTPPLYGAAPPPLPGYEQRWVRVRVLGQEDPSNLLKQKQRGWEPRPKDTLPKDYLTLVSAFGGESVLRNQDSILCQRRVETGEKYRNYILHQGRRLKASVQEFVRDRMPRQPGTQGGRVETFSSQTETGRPPKVAPD